MNSENGASFVRRMAALEKRAGGRLGAAAVSQAGKTRLLYRGGERFALCSTFKALLAAATLARVDAGKESLRLPLPFKESDLLEYAPIVRKSAENGKWHMTPAELNAASVQYSDNTAANILLRTLGGPAGLTRYLRSLGDTITRLDRNEPSLNTNLPGDPRDTTTPLAMARTLQKLIWGDALSPASRQQLNLWLLGNTTGDRKIRAGLPAGWLVGDKTGSGENGAANDVAVIYPRGIEPFILTVYYTGSSGTGAERDRVIAETARLAAERLRQLRG